MPIPNPIFVIVMGVCGSGKSTLGTALAKEIGLPYVDGDDLHPPENLDKMSQGIPLDDDDRWGWLRKIREQGANACKKHDLSHLSTMHGLVIGCSALKKSYRAVLRGEEPLPKQPRGISNEDIKEESEVSLTEGNDPFLFPTAFVFISGSRDELFKRMEGRKGHFMKESMLESQLATLEAPDPTTEIGIITVDLMESTEAQVQKAVQGLSILT